MSKQWSRRSLCEMAISASAFTSLGAFGVLGDDGTNAFRDLVIAIGRRHFPGMPFATGDRVVLSGDHTLYLDNIRHTVAGLPPALREQAIVDWLRKFTPEADKATQAITAKIGSWSGARPLLRPRLMLQTAAEAIPDLLHDPFQADLAIFYTIDLGDKDLYVGGERFAPWDVTRAQLHDTAIANLEAITASIPLTLQSYDEAKGHYLFVQQGDGYDAARILLPGFRKRLLRALEPMVFVGVPAKDLMICWSADFSFPEGMVDLVERSAARLPHAVSTQVFALSEQGLSRVYLATDGADARRQEAQHGGR